MGWFGDDKVEKGQVHINMSYGEYKEYKRGAFKEKMLLFAFIAFLFVFYMGLISIYSFKARSPEANILPAIVGTSIGAGIISFWIGYAIIKRFYIIERFVHTRNVWKLRLIKSLIGFALMTITYLVLFSLAFIS